MKKKMALAVLGLTIALTACAGEQSAGRSDASQATAESSVCEHDWQEATFEQPKTCAICGETEGDRLKDYFSEQGVSVAQTQPRVEQPLQFVSYLSDSTDVQVAHTDGTFAIETSSESAKEEGKKIVKVTITHNLPVFSDDSTDGYFDIAFKDAFFDFTSGELIIREEELTTGNAPPENEMPFLRRLTINGEEVEIQAGAAETWTNSGWYLNDQDVEEDDYVCVRNYEFLLPSDYNGLVYASLPISEYVPAEAQPEGTKAVELVGAEEIKKATLIRVVQ